MTPTVIYVKQVIPQIQTPTFQSNILLNIWCIVIINTNHLCFEKVLDIISKGGVKGIAHITGGGLTDDIPGVFQEGLGATIYQDSWEVPAVFKWIQEVINKLLSEATY